MSSCHLSKHRCSKSIGWLKGNRVMWHVEARLTLQVNLSVPQASGQPLSRNLLLVSQVLMPPTQSNMCFLKVGRRILLTMERFHNSKGLWVSPVVAMIFEALRWGLGSCEEQVASHTFALGCPICNNYRDGGWVVWGFAFWWFRRYEVHSQVFHPTLWPSGCFKETSLSEVSTTSSTCATWAVSSRRTELILFFCKWMRKMPAWSVENLKKETSTKWKGESRLDLWMVYQSSLGLISSRWKHQATIWDGQQKSSEEATESRSLDLWPSNLGKLPISEAPRFGRFVPTLYCLPNSQQLKYEHRTTVPVVRCQHLQGIMECPVSVANTPTILVGLWKHECCSAETQLWRDVMVHVGSSSHLRTPQHIYRIIYIWHIWSYHNIYTYCNYTIISHSLPPLECSYLCLLSQCYSGQRVFADKLCRDVDKNLVESLGDGLRPHFIVSKLGGKLIRPLLRYPTNGVHKRGYYCTNLLQMVQWLELECWKAVQIMVRN